MTRRHVCVHGHFYQPPRENPWLEAVERQDSAHPYHDWNERVTAECYAPNASSRILDGAGRIVEIVNNYAGISYNFGPTLLSWMQEHVPDVYRAVVDADAVSRERFGGHGSAMAQAYGHMILPLSNRRDKRTQIRWGVQDFEQRFGRAPEGMWLPETAVDLETLDLMAEEGIVFTVLAPRQASAVRPLVPGEGDPERRTPHEGPDPGREQGQRGQDGGPGRPEGDPGPDTSGVEGGEAGSDGMEEAEEPPHEDQNDDVNGGAAWTDVSGGRVDPTRPYLVRLPSGRTITVFFYDGPVSRGIAFEGLLKSGSRFANRLLDLVPGHDGEARLAHIATDGETYGHHHMHGEMALSYALERIRRTEDVKLTNYGEFLASHPPRFEARIVEGSSWSCVHGVERWRSDCGCSTGGRSGWNQKWRGPLRDALDYLRDQIAPHFEAEGSELLRDPWQARDDYVRVVLDRSPESVDAFFDRHAAGTMGEAERTRAFELLELQRHAMLMFTSCGWFFADLSGIETVQVLLYAGRVIQLAEELFGILVEEPFLAILEEAVSNLPEARNGRQIYEAAVRPARVDLPKVAAHFAVRSLFVPPEEDAEDEDREDGEAEVYCYRVSGGDRRVVVVGRSKLIVGWAAIASAITGKSARLSYAAVHAGDHSIIGGVRPYEGTRDFHALGQELEEAFQRGDLPEVVRILDRSYPGSTYSLRSLFRDEQREILEQIFDRSVREAESVLTELYHDRSALMRFVADLGIAQPRVFQVAAEFVLDRQLEAALEADTPDFDQVADLLARARKENVQLNEDDIAFAAGQAMDRLAARVLESPDDPETLGNLERAADLLLALDFEVNIWGAQNAFFEALKQHYPRFMERAAGTMEGEADDGGAPAAVEHVALYRRLAEKLFVAIS